jgi:hypothetical protein
VVLSQLEQNLSRMQVLAHNWNAATSRVAAAAAAAAAAEAAAAAAVYRYNVSEQGV